jgi:hypothetical protein
VGNILYNQILWPKVPFDTEVDNHPFQHNMVNVSDVTLNDNNEEEGEEARAACKPAAGRDRFYETPFRPKPKHLSLRDKILSKNYR